MFPKICWFNTFEINFVCSNCDYPPICVFTYRETKRNTYYSFVILPIPKLKRVWYYRYNFFFKLFCFHFFPVFFVCNYYINFFLLLTSLLSKFRRQPKMHSLTMTRNQILNVLFCLFFVFVYQYWNQFLSLFPFGFDEYIN